MEGVLPTQRALPLLRCSMRRHPRASGGAPGLTKTPSSVSSRGRPEGRPSDQGGRGHAARHAATARPETKAVPRTPKDPVVAGGGPGSRAQVAGRITGGPPHKGLRRLNLGEGAPRRGHGARARPKIKHDGETEGESERATNLQMR